MMSPARRGISIKGATYQRLRWYAKQTGQTMSGLIERWVAADLDAKGEPTVDPRSVPGRKSRAGNVPRTERDRRKYFTW